MPYLQCRDTIPAIMSFQNADLAKLAISDDVVKGLVAGGLGLLGTLATVAYGWLKDRDDISKRANELEEATKVIAFWQSWFTACNELGLTMDEQARDLARDQIDTASERMASLFAFWKIKPADSQQKYESYVLKGSSCLGCDGGFFSINRQEQGRGFLALCFGLI
jgi:hypothetical protein